MLVLYYFSMEMQEARSLSFATSLPVSIAPILAKGKTSSAKAARQQIPHHSTIKID
jgi:hypothetical protein